MESAVSRKSKNYVDDDIDAIPEGHDRAIAIESRRRDTAYHLNRYLEKHTRHSVAPSASLLQGEIVLDRPERHKYAMQVTHDLLETDVTMLLGQLNQVLREDQVSRKRIFRVLAISTIVFFSGALTFWRNVRWVGQSMVGLMCLNASYGVYATFKWSAMHGCKTRASSLLHDLQCGKIDGTSYKMLESWHWKALWWCLYRP